MNTTVRVNRTVQFTFFLVMRLNIMIVTSCESFIAILDDDDDDDELLLWYG